VRHLPSQVPRGAQVAHPAALVHVGVARTARTAEMPTWQGVDLRPACLLLRRGATLYPANVDELLKPNTEGARSEGRLISDAETGGYPQSLDAAVTE